MNENLGIAVVLGEELFVATPGNLWKLDEEHGARPATELDVAAFREATGVSAGDLVPSELAHLQKLHMRGWTRLVEGGDPTYPKTFKWHKTEFRLEVNEEVLSLVWGEGEGSRQLIARLQTWSR